MSCRTPKLQKNIDKGMEREGKISHFMNMWYKSVTQTDPPPITDNTVLSYNSKVSYYYTSDITHTRKIRSSVTRGMSAVLRGISGVEIDSSAIISLVTSALAKTSQTEMSQGYSTYVSQSFKGKFRGIDCVYKPVVVAIAFNFAAEEYGTDADVATYGYWVYLLCMAAPKGLIQDSSLTSIDDELPVKYKIPPDLKIVGRRYMTKAELDAH